MGLDFDFSKLDAQDVLDLAIFVEEEAQDHYQQVAGWMEGKGNMEAASFFHRMAGWEARHREQIAERRRAMFGDAPAKHTRALALEVESPDYDAMSLDMSLRAALDVALAAERRAHDYYDEAVDFVSEPTVVSLLEGLRAAELEHQRMLEAEIAKLDR